jgi:hypothetical protein
MSSFVEYNNSKSFYTMSWIAFAIAFVGMVGGLIYLPLEIATKAFFGMTYLFSVSACFTLAKVIRDKYESEKFVTKIEHAKTEKFLNENTNI